jgi:hypothetical protein
VIVVTVTGVALMLLVVARLRVREAIREQLEKARQTPLEPRPES